MQECWAFPPYLLAKGESVSKGFLHHPEMLHAISERRQIKTPHGETQGSFWWLFFPVLQSEGPWGVGQLCLLGTLHLIPWSPLLNISDDNSDTNSYLAHKINSVPASALAYCFISLTCLSSVNVWLVLFQAPAAAQPQPQPCSALHSTHCYDVVLSLTLLLCHQLQFREVFGGLLQIFLTSITYVSMVTSHKLENPITLNHIIMLQCRLQ